MTFKSINIAQSVDFQYPDKKHNLILTSLHAYSWKAIDYDDFCGKIIPILIVPSDYIYRVEKVGQAIDNFTSLLLKCRQWYREQAKLTFEYSAPIIVTDGATSGEWAYSAQLAGVSTVKEPHLRFKYYQEISQVIESRVSNRKDINFVACVYAGDVATNNEGAAANVGKVALPPSTIIYDHDIGYKFMSTGQKVMLSAAIHELGHSFGLNHPVDQNYWGYSIMSNATVPNAKLFESEVNQLKQSQFLKEI